MNGKVIFTNDIEYELKRIRDISRNFLRKFYVYGSDFKDVSQIQSELHDFIFLGLRETLNPKYLTMFTDNKESDFFVLKYPRLHDIMDRNIEMHQMALKGYKLIIENHPFLSNSDVFWCYFPWSFFNKTLLGYPHAYAFRSAKTIKGIDPFDCSVLASKVTSASETTIQTIFEDIKVGRVALDMETHTLYKEKKKELFETETSPKRIIKELKKFVNNRDNRLKRGFNLLNFNRIFNQYCQGERTLVISNSKVDIYLEAEFWKYINSANLFMKTLWNFR